MYDFNYINELNFNSSVLNYYLDKENPLNKKWDCLSFNLKCYYDKFKDNNSRLYYSSSLI